MKISQLTIQNFRGIGSASLLFPDHVLLIGDNNSGKSTVLEAIDLVLGPDRLSRRPPVDEHDFHLGRYVPKLAPSIETEGRDAEAQKILDPPAEDGASGERAEETSAPKIVIEVTVTDLSAEQRARFGEDYIEWWDKEKNYLFTDPNPAGVDESTITSGLRITFVGQYDAEEDDFEGNTFYTRSLTEAERPELFTKKDKQYCGYLYLRSLRTGSSALSLEHGSLLDIILRLKEVRPQMWEGTIANLSSFNVAKDPALGISGVLESINAALTKYVPREWEAEPHLKVSTLTREHLRKVVTAFIATGNGDHAAPFFRQGTGTINMLVLAILSQIAEDKQNVIFAMEEPETAIPPYAQKRLVHEIRKLSSQSIFTSHSPYVLEELPLEQTFIFSRSPDVKLNQSTISFPANVKHKRYRQDFRTRFCEGLLASRVLIAEGATEAASFPVAARRLAEIDSSKYVPLEALGICTIDAGSETQIADLAGLYRGLGKKTFGLCDKQSDESKAAIETQVDELFMHDEKGFENLVLKGTTQAAMERFADVLEWPAHILAKYPAPKANVGAALGMYFSWAKGNWGIADFLAQCSEAEIPEWIRNACASLRQLCDPPPIPKAGAACADEIPPTEPTASG